MPPKVALIIPERKLLNLGVFAEKMKAPCLFSPPRWEGGHARTASCEYPRGWAEHGEAGARGCLQLLQLGEQTARLWVWGKTPDGGDSQTKVIPGAGGTQVLCAIGRRGLSYAVPPLLLSTPPPVPPQPTPTHIPPPRVLHPRGFSEPHISGRICRATLLQRRFLHLY